MTYSELRELIAMQFKNTSLMTIVKNVSILRKYIDFCISKNLVMHRENRLTTFTKDDAKEFVHKQALKNKYITKKQLRKYQEMLENAQDVAILECAYVGIRGRTQQDATLEELINLQISPESDNVKNNILTLIRNNGEIRELTVKDDTMQIILDAYNQTEYIGNNGEESTNVKIPIRVSQINKVENYVFRSTGKTKFEPLNATLINSRMHRIQRWLGNQYLTINSLYFSGMIDMAKEILEKNGTLDKLDYLKICARYAYGENPEQYWYNVKAIIQEYLSEVEK
jgi:protein subunit release factor A